LGWGSLKFGVYQRSENKPQRQGYVNDGDYTWMRGFGSTREEAFVNVKSEILKIIQASSCGNFREIDELILPDLFKWKVAFLYSNERLIPVFSREILEGAAAWLEFKADAYAANCFRAALGQLLAYAYGRKVKKIVVVGQNRPTAAEREMIRHLQEKVLRVAFDYEQAAAV
jgi:hypothetical protein